jgi:protoporphyrinogen oxidase
LVQIGLEGAMMNVAVLGAGLAGLAAAQRCRETGVSVDVYEKNPYLGGHASSLVVDGFTFDEGPHVSFTKIDAVKKLFADALQGNYREFASIVTNYFKGFWVPHPAQVNLHGLPPDLVTRCLVDMISAQAAPAKTPNNYEEWLYCQFGKTFSEEFPFRYTRKYWTVEPAAMATEWIGPRVYKPKLEEVIRGAVSPREDNLHYITQFRYPSQGGFGAYTRAVQSDARVHLSQPVELIDPARRSIQFANGLNAGYDKLISSLPLPELIRRIKDAPLAVRYAAKQLAWTSVALVDVGVERDTGFPDAHWLYFYDEDLCFARASYPHLLAPSNVPHGCGSVQVEIYYSRFKELPCRDLLNRAIEDMHRVGLLRRDDRVRVAQLRKVTYANVLFDHHRRASLAIINDFLASLGILCCGRYGLWNYHWTDESIVSGWDAAKKAVDSAGKRRVAQLGGI